MATHDQHTDGVGGSTSDPSPDELRERAIARLRKRADFRTHVLVYVLVNSTLVVIWAITGPVLFWPIFPILAWGVGLAANAWDVYRPDPVTEERIQEEMGRLRP